MMRWALLLASLALPAQAETDAQRIVAIGGSITEFIFAMGEQDRLIARDSTSYYPSDALELPDVGYMRALSAEGVLSVKPDMILAEEGAGPAEAVELLKQAGIAYVEIPTGASDDGVLAKADAVAAAIGADDAAVLEALSADLKAADAAADAVESKQRVLFILTLQGGRVMAAGAGTEAQAIIEMAGAENAIKGFEGYKPLTDEAVISAAPDAILMMDRGDGAIDLAKQKADVLAVPAIAATPAGKEGRVIRMNGLYLLGFGPRTGKAALDLNRAIYGSS